MASFYLAPCLSTLRAEIDKAHPNRDRRSDGWVGDTRHAASKSDHNPDYPDGGVVRALDVDKDGVNMTRLLAVAIKNPATNYVIWNGHIYSRAYNFRKRVYTGRNKHTIHMHISIRHGKTYENRKHSWGYLSAPSVPAKSSSSSAYYGDCTLLQKAVRVTPDNYWGDNTEKACNAVRWAVQNKFPYGVKFAQEVVGTKQDGAWGPNSRAYLKATIVVMQKALSVESHTALRADGIWITQTESAYQKVRAICRR